MSSIGYLDIQDGSRSKVNQNRLLLVLHALKHDVVRLDIAVDKALVVELAYGLADLKEDTETSFFGEGPDADGVGVELLDLVPNTAVTVEGREEEVLLRAISRVIK